MILTDEAINAYVKSRLADPNRTPEEIEYLHELVSERFRLKKLNKALYFKSYPFQSKFYKQGAESRFRFLSAATRIGKSKSAAMEMGYHLTGLYPSDWEGYRFTKPVSSWAIGITTDSTKDVLQYELLGVKSGRALDNTMFDDMQMGVLGSGSIPIHCINKDSIARDGERILSIKIKHHNAKGDIDGESLLEFKSTQQGQHVLMGVAKDLIWLDEEDPTKSMEIWEQCFMRTTTTHGLVIITATPENGNTKLIKQFRYNDNPDFYFQTASVFDAHTDIGGHLSDYDIENIKSGVAPHKLKMRLYGEPTQGEGLVWDLDYNKIIINPIEIPDHWKQVVALDLGNAHKSAAIKTAYDPVNDCVYVVWEYGGSELTPATIASVIRKRDQDIPVILPRDAWFDRGTGANFYELYRDEKINVQSEEFYNKYTINGAKDFSVEFGIEEMRIMMLEGRLKIFNTCEELIKEMNNYHRKVNESTGVSKIVKVDDDYCDAFRYSVMSVKHRGVPKSGSRWNTGESSRWKS
ncbi:TPA: terminase family protein [Escherichia coli]|nr:terminase family protein [Escherichia coli]